MYTYSRIYFCTSNILNERLKPVFLVQNDPLNLCSSAVNSQRLLCSQKAGVKCLY